MEEIDHRLSELFKVLGNGKRLQAMLLLRRTPRSVGELADELDRSVSATSQHLRQLRDQDLVMGESRGNRRIYRLKRPELLEACLALRTHLSRDDSER